LLALSHWPAISISHPSPQSANQQLIDPAKR